MKLLGKCVILLLAFVPFLWKLPVLIKSWGIYENSKDPFFMIAAFALCAILVWRRYKEGLSSDIHGGLTLAIPSAAVMVLGFMKQNMMFFWPDSLARLLVVLVRSSVFETLLRVLSFSILPT